MKLSKNQIIILSVIVVIIVAYFIFKKPSAPKTVASPKKPADASAPAESSYGYMRTDKQEMATASGTAAKGYPY